MSERVPQWGRPSFCVVCPLRAYGPRKLMKTVERTLSLPRRDSSRRVFRPCHAALFDAAPPVPAPRRDLHSPVARRVHGRPQETMVCPTAIRLGAEHE